tara:strand:+ start:71 stop:751 length:681 start_codon:yes stop_codon:yes gene_type:complete
MLVCESIIQSRGRKGNKCGRKCLKGMNVCGYHCKKDGLLPTEKRHVSLPQKKIGKSHLGTTEVMADLEKRANLIFENAKKQNNTLCCADLDLDVSDSYKNLYHALREVHQKQLMNNKKVKELKKKHRYTVPSSEASGSLCQKETLFKCPVIGCENIVKQLHTAHVGITACDIIKRAIGDTMDPETSFQDLLNKVINDHKPYYVTVCCPKCNKLFEYVSIAKNLELN